MTSPTDITQYSTVRSWYMRKRIDHWCSVVPEKIPTLGSTVQWETRQASFPTPTGTVGPRVGIIVSPLNTNDGFYLSYPCYLTHRAVVVFWKVVRPLNAVDVHRVQKARVGGEHERGYDPLSLGGLGGSPP